MSDRAGRRHFYCRDALVYTALFIMKFQQVSRRDWQCYLVFPGFFDTKSKMFLAQVAEDDHNDCSEQL